ncbi:uncharacterized protein THITE_2121011 [Thermothielavioides terrestris NRRL 8126]|jgi:copper transporter 1|uniref:Copper transport protein n=1 Tax=Thermothielavioides terrestris (strain ATCC 38088 / NRRL 8126) TaxID=578455 RepID=G2RE57_THETT|nr:uncharacterized protein THITE_2121011 [Thermothielavioides terrestris NRRL 8126]AEO70084.1 hypothetical protein THITE_2121011 [Thermothielavioides terrestris NRRL 8126]
MLFTWDTTNLCIVFRQWHITSNLGLVASLVAVVAICAGYEALREGIRRYEAALSRRVDTVPRKFVFSLSGLEWPFPSLTHPPSPNRVLCTLAWRMDRSKRV